MTTRRLSSGFGALALCLTIFGLVPSEAKAIEVMCSNEFGHCEVQDNPSWISCTCNNESSTGGTGGDEYQGLSEEELQAICAAELAYCEPDVDTGVDTFGTSDTGQEDVAETSDSGQETSTTGGEESTTGGEEGTTSDSGGDSGTTGGEEGTTGGEEGTTSDSGGDSGSDSGGESSGDGLTSADEAGDAGTGDGDAAADEADGCSVANDSGLGALAFFGLFGLLGLRSRKR